MKTLKLSLVIMAAALLTVGLSGMAYAFHSGGVAECGGCHSMHSPKVGGSFLLINSDQSSTCLSCHSGPTLSSYHVLTYPAPAAGAAPVNMTPGGDFAWLYKTYTFTVRGTVNTEAGQTHGHNVVATDFGIAADSDFPTAPGGTFPTSQLACNSCHDPHGKYRRIGGDTTYTIATTGAPVIGSGSYNNSAVPTATQAVGVYRLLAGSGYSKVAYPGVPAASAPSTYNQVESTNQVRVAYGTTATGSGKTTWGQWCATCHGAMHSTGNYVHPVDQGLGSTIANLYGTYISSGNMGGSPATSYLSLVPFMENTGDYATLKTHASNTNAYLNGPGSSDQVSCLSCHRAHASGFMDMMRWQMEGEFITVADGTGTPIWPGTDNGAPVQFARGRTAAETQAAYGNRPVTVFGAYQRVLCNKCHAQD
jgi:predicted CXXCH cytochrome family protein